MRVAILGSCITRDSVEYWPPALELVDYRARHPLASLPHPSRVLEADVPARPKGWRRAQHLRDIASTTVPEMLTHDPDIILWDLADERLGAHRRFDGGWAAGEGVKYHSLEYQGLWTAGLDALLELTAGVPIVLNAVEWDMRWPTAHTFARWQQWACFQARLRSIPTVRTRGTTANENHQWGPAPFHLIADDYRRMALNLTVEAERVARYSSHVPSTTSTER